MNSQSVIIKPVITESSIERANTGRFTFQVDRFANKNAIKEAIEKKFNVHVISIHTTILKGRSQRVGVRREEKKLTSVKKATVQLKSGEKIDMFDMGGQS